MSPEQIPESDPLPNPYETTCTRKLIHPFKPSIICVAGHLTPHRPMAPGEPRPYRKRLRVPNTWACVYCWAINKCYNFLQPPLLKMPFLTQVFKGFYYGQRAAYMCSENIRVKERWIRHVGNWEARKRRERRQAEKEETETARGEYISFFNWTEFRLFLQHLIVVYHGISLFF